MRRRTTSVTGAFESLLSIFALAGCGAGIPPEPEGTPVTLSADELDVQVIHPEKRQWYGWHRKGLSLVTAGEYDKALYCFHRAVEAWPREMEDESQPARHKPKPTDAYLQKAALYLKMGEPELAIGYYDKFEESFPGNKIAVEGRAKAEEMLAD
jgi:tetratricopeptide (TPR) repeat protein